MSYPPTSKSFEFDAFRTEMDALCIVGKLDYFGFEELTGAQRLTGVLDSENILIFEMKIRIVDAGQIELKKCR